MKPTEQAVKYFKEGYNCSQAVLAAFCEDFNISRADAFKIASGFGGGMFIGGTCGAVTGAFMVLGLKFGEDKQKPYDKIVEFAERFRQKNHSLNCNDLIKYDIRTIEGKEKAASEGLFKTVCPQMVKDAVEILESMFQK
jgi:C_GCAxxG_C_C family probable redox protein